MIRYFYGWKDNLADYFPKPQSSDLTPDDQTEAMIREMKRMKPEDLKKNEDFSFYLLASFDDKTGIFKSEVRKLFDTPKVKGEEDAQKENEA